MYIILAGSALSTQTCIIECCLINFFYWTLTYLTIRGRRGINVMDKYYLKVNFYVFENGTMNNKQWRMKNEELNATTTSTSYTKRKNINRNFIQFWLLVFVLCCVPQILSSILICWVLQILKIIKIVYHQIKQQKTHSLFYSFTFPHPHSIYIWCRVFRIFVVVVV